MDNKLTRRLAILLSFICISSLASAEVLINRGATWQYYDGGQEPPTTWKTDTANSAGWESGRAQLGYGDGDERTVLGYGGDRNNKYITSYFRREFQLSSLSDVSALRLEMLVDDGAVIFINGSEVHRHNMPSGSINRFTLAASTISGSEEDEFSIVTIPITSLQTGSNAIAVEIHQRGNSSSDISFDMSVETVGAGEPVRVVRGPYLQMGSEDGMTIKWRTDIPTSSRVLYGEALDNLTQSVDSADFSTEHELRLSNLTPSTRYYYAVANLGSVLISANADQYFETSPVIGSDVPTRIWVIGDSGTANNNARRVYDAYMDNSVNIYTNLWLMLGDNAYNDGTDSEYQRAVFNMYPDLLKQTPVWSALGNHDGYSADSQTESGPYYDIFTLPRNAEVGGAASGTEAYYSFNHANIHFVVLDSYDSDRSSNSAMLNWLEFDLQSMTSDWLVAFWHHPPYTKGSHDSDRERNLIEMRENALPLLEQYGVDLVLTGHSHSYERTMLIDGHYGSSNTFSANNIKDGGSGDPTDTGAYQKSENLTANEGAVYVVAGSSGKISGGRLDHPAMHVSLNLLGSVILDVNGLVLDAQFMDDNGNIRDRFTIDKRDDSVETYTISGQVWRDNDQSGTRQAGETPIAGIELRLLGADDVVLSTQQSNASGEYQFTDLIVGEYSVSIAPGDLDISPQNVGSDDTVDSDFNVGTSVSDVISIVDQDVANVDAGLWSSDTRTEHEYILFNDDTGYFGTEDSTVLELAPGYNFGGATVFISDGVYSSYGQAVALIKWNLEEIPADAEVLSAQIVIDAYDRSLRRYDVFLSEAQWNEDSVTWNSIDPLNNVGDRVGEFTPENVGEWEIPLNQIGRIALESWISGSALNNGFLILDSGTPDGVYMYASERSDVSLRPQLRLRVLHD